MLRMLRLVGGKTATPLRNPVRSRPTTTRSSSEGEPMTARQLVDRCLELGVRLARRGDQIVARPAARLPADLVAGLKRYKADLLTLLSAEPWDRDRAMR